MNKHLCKIEVPSGKTKSDMIFDRVNELIFEFENYTLLVDGHGICEITLTPEENIIIEHGFFDANLYNAYVNNDNILSIIEKGWYIDTRNAENPINYRTSYKNYRIKSISGSKISNCRWIYILEKMDR